MWGGGHLVFVGGCVISVILLVWSRDMEEGYVMMM